MHMLCQCHSRSYHVATHASCHTCHIICCSYNQYCAWETLPIEPHLKVKHQTPVRSMQMGTSNHESTPAIRGDPTAAGAEESRSPVLEALLSLRDICAKRGLLLLTMVVSLAKPKRAADATRCRRMRDGDSAMRDTTCIARPIITAGVPVQ